MLTGIAATASAATPPPLPRPARNGQSFLATLSSADAAPTAALPETAAVGAAKWPAASMPLDDAGAPDAAAKTKQETMLEKMGASYRRFYDLMNEAFGPVSEATGQPMSEEFGYSRQGDHFQFFGVGQNSTSQNLCRDFSYPQAKILDAVFNGTDPAYANLTRQVKALLKQADQAYLESQEQMKQYADDLGIECAEGGLDNEFVFCVPTLFADEGRARAAQNPTGFAEFHATLGTAELSEDQVYSRYFMHTASKEEMKAALRAVREKEARAEAAVRKFLPPGVGVHGERSVEAAVQDIAGATAAQGDEQRQ